LDGVDMTFYADEAAVDAALLGGTIDLINQISVTGDRPLLKNAKVQIFPAPGSTHREIPMRVDLHNQLSDFRVRQAIALTLDRPEIIKTLWAGRADLGNDSPFAPIFPSTAPVPQRHKNLRLAKQLMSAAGQGKGFSIQLTTEKTQEIPDL